MNLAQYVDIIVFNVISLIYAYKQDAKHETSILIKDMSTF